MLDVDTDEFEILNPIEGLDGQPLLSFTEITEAGPFVHKFPNFARFIYASVKAGKQKAHKSEAQAYGLTQDDIALIFLYTVFYSFIEPGMMFV